MIVTWPLPVGPQSLTSINPETVDTFSHVCVCVCDCVCVCVCARSACYLVMYTMVVDIRRAVCVVCMCMYGVSRLLVCVAAAWFLVGQFAAV